MNVDAIAFIVTSEGNQHTEKYVPAHRDRASIAVCARIGEFEAIFAAEAASTASTSAELEFLERHRLVKKLKLLAQTGLTSMMYRQFTCPRTRPPECDDRHRHGERQQIEKGITSHGRYNTGQLKESLCLT